MTADRLIATANLSFPDGRVWACWDKQNAMARFDSDNDDALAFFIASAVEDHYNDRLTSEEQLTDLIEEIEHAQYVFERVVRTLKRERTSIRQHHARLGEEHKDEQST